MHSLFTAVRCTLHARSAIETIFQKSCAAHGLHGTRVPADLFHITLHHIGEFSGNVPQDVVQPVSAICAEVAATMPPFEVRLARAMSFGNKRGYYPFVLLDAEDGNLALKGLYRRLEGALKGAGFRVTKSFTPHLTLLRSKQIIAVESVDPVSWTVGEFFLLDSHIGKTHHEVRGSWPLIG